MENIKKLWDDVKITIDDSPKYKWNEAELTSAVVEYKNIIDWILEKKDLLIRKCIIWDIDEHNNKIKEIYDSITAINNNYELLWINYRINIINHLTDDDWNIYIENINTNDRFNVYDIIPDNYYLDLEKKDKSKFKDFKNAVKELRLNKLFIIPNIFEQLAILHANNFVVWEIELWEKILKHPTLSLFLYKLRNAKWNLNEELFIHDIHNLKQLDDNTSSDYINNCINDLKNLSFDIIKFFKWVWLPQWWLIIYWKVLKELNPDLYKIMYNSFLRDPKIELEINAIENADSKIKKERKLSEKVIKELNTFNKWNKKEEIKRIFLNDDIFYLLKSKNKIVSFFEDINPDNTEIIIDFDNTLTYPWSENSLNINFSDNWEKIDEKDINKKSFLFRKWAITFIRLAIKKWYDIKIYSLWINDLIYQLLVENWIVINKENIYSNNLDELVYDKTNIEIDINYNKKRLILWDNIVDFEKTRINDNDLCVWFLNQNNIKSKKEKKLEFNNLLDFYFINSDSNFLLFYNLFKHLD